MLAEQLRPAVRWPASGAVSVEWAAELALALAEASQAPARRLPRWLPATVFSSLVCAAGTRVAAEQTLIELVPPPGASVVVVGDTHGQFHDLLHIFQLAGSPAPDRCYIFNGDYVDRGAWGVETLSLVLAWKLALPASVVVLRGNHESRFCCSSYGFFRELAAKYGSSACALQKPLLRLFSSLPLGCRVGAAFVCHGGLFRKSARAARGGCRAADAAAEDGSLPLSALGSLEELRCASRGSADPDGQGERRLASDVLWSDPGRDPGLRENALRGIGLVFGPDATQAFLRANGLRLVIRSHEGPDAREKRADMGSMGDGWSVDHEGAEGRLATLFSAPDYPMFYAPGAARARNRAAVALLSQPSFCQPQLLRFEAAPRPDSGCAYYELDAPGSDEEGGAPRAAEAAGAGAKRVAEGEPVEDSAPADAEPPATQSPSRGAAAEADTPATCAVSLPAS